MIPPYVTLSTTFSEHTLRFESGGSPPPAQGARVGELIEFGESRRIFTNSIDERTEAYITGRFR